jgi:hypothetical protein
LRIRLHRTSDVCFFERVFQTLETRVIKFTLAAFLIPFPPRDILRSRLVRSFGMVVQNPYFFFGEDDIISYKAQERGG